MRRTDSPHREQGHSGRTILLVCLLAILSLAAAPAAHGAEKGLQTDLSWKAPAADEPRTMEALAGTGVQWIRLDISWRKTERTQGVYDAAELAMTDRAMELAERVGAKIIMAVSETPAWASGSTAINTPPRDNADFARFVGEMVERYKGRVAGWEIWNEPNHPRFWSPSPDAGQYARLLKAAAPAVRANDPGAKVLFAGLAHNDYPYLEQAYAAVPDLGDYFDVMATHPYTKSGQSPAIVDRRPDGRMTTTSFLAIEEVREVMLDHGDDKPIWLTEMGWSTNSQVLLPLGGVSEALQAAYLTLAFTLLEAVPYVEVAIVYNFRNNYWAADADNWEDQLGLLRTDFSRKPAYYAFAAIGAVTRPETTKPAGATAPAPITDAPAPPAPQELGLSSTPEVTLEVTKVKRGPTRTSMRIVGRLSASLAGRAKIVLERRKGNRWARVSAQGVEIRAGRFAKSLSVRRGGRWRVKASVAAGKGTVSARPVSLRA